ncbi:hypothetical protein Zmor_004723 [Zophobas morio]|uniref:Uncharacterized protein n=1 Tax=Zophobas morio TaxID=2755281 RepID=A0AA38IUT2_9CUCU|nr:hypothetical protein Zmor_004723 [Zophobas morio]
MKNAKRGSFSQSETDLVKNKTNGDSLVSEYDTTKRKRKAQAEIDLGVDSGASKRQKKNKRLSQESVIVEETSQPPVSSKKKKKKKYVDQSEVEEQLPPVEFETHEENTKKKKHKKERKENITSKKKKHVDNEIQVEAYSEEDTKRHKHKKKKYEDDQIADSESDALVAPKKKKKKRKNEHEVIKEEKSKIKEEKTERKRKKQENTKWSVIFSDYNFDTDDEDRLKEEVAWLEAEAEEIKEKNRLNSAEEKKLSELRINVPWPVPPLHMIETRITMRPNEQQKKAIEDLGVPIKSATYYSKTEDEQITKNWKEFCKMHDLPEDPKPFHNTVNPDGQVIISLPERLNFARFLAHNLHDRLLCSVYKRFRRLFPQQQQKTGSRFTPEEDAKIVKYLAKSSSRTPCADLGALLGRNKDAIEKRARILKEEASFGNLDVKWDTERIQEFINHAVEVTQVKKVKHLKKREITTEEWRRLEERLRIPVRKLQKGWACRIYPTLFVKVHASTMQVKESLIRLLVQRGERDFKTVDWNLIQEELGQDGQGFTGRGLHELLQGMIYHCVPVEQRNDAKGTNLCLTKGRFINAQLKVSVK